jgi:hypothetical protein
MRDFQRLLLELLGVRQQATKTQAFLLSSEGEGRVEEITEERSLRSIWEETFPDVLERCYLTIEIAETFVGQVRNAVVEFSPTELREEVRNSFFGSHYPLYLELFRQVKERQFLFDESPRVIDQTVELIVGMALSQPAELAGPGLGGLVQLDQIPRAYPLLRAFLQNAPLRDRVAQLLQEMLLAKRFNSLIELAWKLRDIGGFKGFVWLKRVLDEGTPEARQRAYWYLLQMVRAGGTAEILQEIFRWLPNCHSSNLAYSSMVAESFFIDLNAQLLFKAERWRKGWPPANPILAAAHRDPKNAIEQLAVRWLFHPSTAHVFKEELFEEMLGWGLSTWFIPKPLLQEDVKCSAILLQVGPRWFNLRDDPTFSGFDDDFGLIFFPALVLADWAVELSGLASTATEARALYDRLLGALAEECSTSKRQVLSLLWSTIEESLLDILLFIEEIDPATPDFNQETISFLRQDLRLRRSCVRQLRLDLQSHRREANHR